MSVFEPYKIKNLELRNGIVMAPMCQYSAKDGIPNDWHTTHYLSRAHDGVGIIIVEMMNVEPKAHYRRLPRHMVRRTCPPLQTPCGCSPQNRCENRHSDCPCRTEG